MELESQNQSKQIDKETQNKTRKTVKWNGEDLNLKYLQAIAKGKSFMNKTSLINDSNQLNKFTLLEKHDPNYETKYNDLEEEYKKNVIHMVQSPHPSNFLKQVKTMTKFELKKN